MTAYAEENELCIRLGAPLDGYATAQSARSAN